MAVYNQIWSVWTIFGEATMSALDQLPGSASPVLAHQGLLPSALRRDLTDLNGLYLELGLSPGAEDDPRFAWPASAGKWRKVSFRSATRAAHWSTSP